MSTGLLMWQFIGEAEDLKGEGPFFFFFDNVALC